MYNIALIGCGRISGKHLESISKLKNDLKLVAVCDIVKERAKDAGEKYGVDWYTDYQKMLERDDIDVVSICTPSGLHPEHGIAAA
ncbi:MAG: Gfo/Idh/MocA family oxidoreductase, partial [Candidatus Marinimicrobia bacterium]|nr:Gfo/Idh/MocA family oxidoreductase [Candidatus Neomarinimicrobiota bacterium]